MVSSKTRVSSYTPGKRGIQPRFSYTQKGLIPIGKEKKRIDWNAIRAGCIAGESYRALADQYGVTKDAIARKAKAENWQKDRETAARQSALKSIQKISDSVSSAAADNATLAASIKRKLLQRLERVVDAFPEDADGTEIRDTDRNRQTIYRLKDLASMYKDLTADMPTGENVGSELLQSLMELEQEARDG